MMQQPGGSFRPFEAQNGHSMGHQRRNSTPQIYSVSVLVHGTKVESLTSYRRYIPMSMSTRWKLMA